MDDINCRLYGKCWGDPDAPVRLVVKWEGRLVFDGTVPTSTDMPDARATDYGILCEWTIDRNDRGPRRVEVTSYNGSTLVHNILISNVVTKDYMRLKPDAVWPKHKPEDWEDFRLDMDALDEAEFIDVYGFDQDAAFEYVEQLNVAAADNWVDGNFNTYDANGYFTDGKTNVKLNNIAWPPDPPYTQPYERNYFFENGDTLGFDYLIEWDNP